MVSSARPATYVVEPQGLFVPLLSEVLAASGLEVVEVGANLDVPRVLLLEPDVIFIDPDFAPVDTLEAVRTLRSLLPHARICIYTSRHQPSYSRSCVEAGATCVIAKVATESELVDALGETIRGAVYADPRVDAA